MKAFITNAIRSILIGSLILMAAFGLSAQQVELVSANVSGTGSGDRDSLVWSTDYRSVGNNRYVAFISRASDLVANGPSDGIRNLYVRDLQTEVTELASPDFGGKGGANAPVSYSEISENGRYVAFSSAASNLVLDDTNNAPDLFLRDLAARTTVRIAMDIPSLDYSLYAFKFSISDDGTKLAFTTRGSNVSLPRDLNRVSDVYVFDLVTRTTSLVSVDRYGQRAGNGNSEPCEISGNGRFVVFESTATNLVPEFVPRYSYNVFVRDLQSGTTRLVSRSLQGTGIYTGILEGNRRGQITRDGSLVTFYSFSEPLVPEDQNGTGDVYQYDLNTGAIKLASANQQGTGAGNQGANFDYSVTPDGRYIGFISRSSDLIPGEGSNQGECYLRDLETGTIKIASKGLFRAKGYSNLEDVHISASGRFVGFNCWDQLDPTVIAYRVSTNLYDRSTDLALPIPGATSADTGWLLMMGFSSDERFMVFGGFAQLSPNDNNDDHDVFVMQLNPKGKRNQLDKSGVQGHREISR